MFKIFAKKDPVFCEYCGARLIAVTKKDSYDPHTGLPRTYLRVAVCPKVWDSSDDYDEFYRLRKLGHTFFSRKAKKDE